MSRGHLAQKKSLENNLAKEHEETEKNLVDVEEFMKKYEVGELLPEDFSGDCNHRFAHHRSEGAFTVDHS